MVNKWIVIGIGGATCSGKTTLAKALHSALPGSILIHQDDYYYPLDSGKLEYIEELKHNNYDQMSAIDIERLVADLNSILQGHDCNGKRKILIIEGTLILNVEYIVQLCTLKYYVTVSKEVSEERRRTRKYKRYDPAYFEKVTWPSYLKFKAEVFEKYPDIPVLNGEYDISVNVQNIRGNVTRLLDN